MKNKNFLLSIIYTILGLLSTAIIQLIFPNISKNHYIESTQYLPPLILVYFLAKRNKYERYLKKTSSMKNIIKYVLPLSLIVTINILALVNLQLKPDYLKLIINSIILPLSIAFFEEILFRNIIFHKMLESYSFKTSAIASAIFFALFHIGNLTNNNISNVAVQIIYSFMLGVYFIGIYVKTNNIYIPIFAHFIIDFSANLSSLYISKPKMQNINTISIIITILTVLPAFIKGLSLLKNFCKIKPETN